MQLRTLATLLALFCCFSLFAQKPTFYGVRQKKTARTELNLQFKTYEIYQIDVAALHSFVKKGDSEVRFQLNLGEHFKWSILLHPKEIRSQDYLKTVLTDKGKEYFPKGETITFQGHLLKRKGGAVALTITKDLIYGFVKEGSEIYFIEPLWYFNKNAPRDQFVLYASSNVIPQPGKKCGALELTDNKNKFKQPEKTIGGGVEKVGNCLEVELAIASDLSMFNKYGSVANVEAHNLGVMLNVQTNYDNEFADELRFVIVEQFIVSPPATDPWTSSNNAGTVLNSFTNWGPTGFTATHDLGQFWTNRDFTSNTVGIAWIGAVCTSFRYHALQDFTTNATFLRVLVSHEIGHNFNASHDPFGSPFIMAPVINNTNAWSAASVNSINNYVTFVDPPGGCLSSCSGLTPPVAQFSSDVTNSCVPFGVNFQDISTGNPTSWQWSFPGGTPNSSTLQNPTVTYNTAGNFDVSLTATNAGGSHSITQSGYVVAEVLPTVGFTLSTDGLNAQFFNTTSGTVNSYSWNFGDGFVSNLANPSHTYSAPGNYTVTLSATNNCGTATHSTTVIVSAAPTAGFTADVTSGCVPLTVNFQDLSSSNSTNWSWTFEGGSPANSSVPNPTVSFPSAGTYNVSLVVSNSAGSNGLTRTNYITVSDVPTAGFSASITNSTVNFTNTTIDGVSYVWNFGDGTNSIAFSPTHTYPEDGTYSVILIASNGCGSNTLIQSVTINTLPVAAFSANATSGCTGLNVQFADQSSSNATGWNWSFPGGTPSSSPAQNPSVTYNNPGNFSVTLTVSNAAGNDTATEPDFIAVADVPTAGFGISVVDRTVNFSNITTNGVSYVWNFGDGTNSTAFSPTHTYTEDGTFPVILIANNGCGSSTLIQTVTISTLPTADFTANVTNGCASFNVQFSDQSSSNTTSWSWSFPGGNPSFSNSPNPVVAYITRGTYDVSLTVANANGNASTTKAGFISVEDVPSAGFGSSISERTVNFTNTSFHADSYFWQFGDGSSSTLLNPVHTFTSDGIYTVQLNATNACGTNSIAETITIVTVPTAAFSANASNGCVPFVVQFNDLSSANTTSWNWSFPGGTPAASTLQNPSVTYNASGIFDVSLDVSNVAGTNSISQASFISVGDVPTAAFSTTLDLASATFANNSDNASSFFWDFGDGNNSIVENPSHTYAADGNYTVVLSATNPCGTTTATQTLTVITPPSAAFSSNTANGCAPFTVHFDDLSSTNATSWNWTFPGGNPATSTEQNPTIVYNAKGIFSVTLQVSNAAGSDSFAEPDYITAGDVPSAAFSQSIIGFKVSFANNSTDADSFTWHFGDGETSTVLSPLHTYEMDGLYPVELIATNECGSDTITAEINIVTEPTASFSASATTGCVPLIVQFFDQSSSNATTWEWTFEGGDPSFSNQQNPQVAFNEAGNYSVILVASNAAGSSTSVQNNLLQVNNLPAVGFSTTVDGATAQFDNTSANANQFFWNFGDGVTSTAMNPSHFYSEDGIYFITLIATNECGSVTTSSEISIATPPTAAFSANATNGCVPFEVQFQNASSSNAVGFLWSFPGGTPNASTDANPLVVYENPGIFEVSLTVSNPTGSETFVQSDFIEVGTIPEAVFTFQVVDSIALFTDNSTNSASAAWTFGDGSSSTETNPAHIYSADGVYTVTLTASNECGAATTSQILAIATSVPVAAFTASATKGCPPFVVSFENLSSPNAFSLEWLFPGGQPASSNEQNPTITFSEPGIYDVSLVASNALGSDTFSIGGFIEVNEFPTAGFDFEIDGLLANFAETSSNAAALQWNFGDGIESTEVNPSHEYQQPGTYSVTLIAFSSCGSDTLTQQIEIAGTSPTAAFNAVKREGCAPFTATFEDLSPGNPTSWNWTFPGGNPSNSTAQNPEVVYDTAGIFDVILEVSNAVGTNTLVSSQFIAVDEAPTSIFNFEVNGSTVSFLNTSTNASSFDWIFGDGISSSESSPVHTFPTFGDFSVTLTATNNCGSRSITQIVTVVVDNVAEIPGIEQFVLFPNPNDGQFTLFLKGQPLPELEVHFYNLLGQGLLREEVDFSGGLLTKQFQFEQLPAGVYFVQLRSGNQALYRKIVVE